MSQEDNGTDDGCKELLDGFAKCSVSNISDNLERAVGAVGIRPLSHGTRLCGRAFTVKTLTGDNAFIHRALDVFTPGQVIVVDGGGFEGRALIGEIMMQLAQARGAAGLVLDGAIRDLDYISTVDFPVFARSAIHLGPHKNGPGALNVPVAIGGMIVNPGDIVVGDMDGVVAFPPSIGKELLEATKRLKAKEDGILRTIADGTYKGQYV